MHSLLFDSNPKFSLLLVQHQDIDKNHSKNNNNEDNKTCMLFHTMFAKFITFSSMYIDKI